MTWLRRRRRDEPTQRIYPLGRGRVPRPPAPAFVGPWPVDGWTVDLQRVRGGNRVRLLLRDHLGVVLSCVEWNPENLRAVLGGCNLHGQFHGGVCHHVVLDAAMGGRPR